MMIIWRRLRHDRRDREIPGILGRNPLETGVRLKGKLRVQVNFLQLDELQVGVWVYKRIEASKVQWISKVYRLLLRVKPNNIPPQECAYS